MILIYSTCMMRITHSITRPPDHPATEYLTCPWSSPLLCTKSPTPASIIVIPHHVAFATYTLEDRQMCFSTPNNWICVSSTGMHRIQIQTRTSQLLITHINQGTNHLVSHKWTYYAMNKGIRWTEAKRIIQGCYTYVLGTMFKDSLYILPLNVAMFVVVHIITTMNSTWSLLFTLS
jgi:hypothetical protein